MVFQQGLSNFFGYLECPILIKLGLSYVFSQKK
jgi:hypothetical protein